MLELLSVLYSLLGVLLEIEVLGKFELRVDFHILKCIQVIDDSLQVDDQHVGQLAQANQLGGVSLLVAFLTEVVADIFPLNEFLEGLF